MKNQKAATGTRSVIKSILWSISTTFVIIGLIEILVFSEDGIGYFITAVIFGVSWIIFTSITRNCEKIDQS